VAILAKYHHHHHHDPIIVFILPVQFSLFNNALQLPQQYFQKFFCYALPYLVTLFVAGNAETTVLLESGSYPSVNDHFLMPLACSFLTIEKKIYSF
jgi:hypothetical protein